MKRKILTAGITALCSLCIFYCERLQFLPKSSAAFLGRAGLCLLISTAFGFVIGSLFDRAIPKYKGRERVCILLCALIGAVYLLIWIPVPLTGILPQQTVTIQPTDDRPLTLTWLKTGYGDALVNFILLKAAAGTLFLQFSDKIGAPSHDTGQ